MSGLRLVNLVVYVFTMNLRELSIMSYNQLIVYAFILFAEI